MDFKKQCEERDKEMRENIRFSKMPDIEDNEENNLIEMVESSDGEEEESIEIDRVEEESTAITTLLNQLKERESEAILTTSSKKSLT